MTPDQRAALRKQKENQMPRALTEDELRQKYLDHVRALVMWWENESRATTPREKLEGLAFSILVMLDGESALPGCKVIPDPHPEDRQYCIDHGENWIPVDVDIAGPLHELFYEKKP